MNEDRRPSQPKKQAGDFRDAAWVLVASSQAGLMLAVPVLLGLAVGYLLDRHFGTLPWITLLFTLVGTVIGPIMIYQWVTKTVRDHLDSRTTAEKENGTEG